MSAFDPVYLEELEQRAREQIVLGTDGDLAERIIVLGEIMAALPADHQLVSRLQSEQERVTTLSEQERVTTLSEDQRRSLARDLISRGDYRSALRVIETQSNPDPYDLQLTKTTLQILDEDLEDARQAAARGDWSAVVEHLGTLKQRQMQTLAAQMLNRAARIVLARDEINVGIEGLFARPGRIRSRFEAAQEMLADVRSSTTVQGLIEMAKQLETLAGSLQQAASSNEQTLVALDAALKAFGAPTLDKQTADTVRQKLQAQRQYLAALLDEEQQIEQQLAAAEQALAQSRPTDALALLPEGLLPSAATRRRQEVQAKARKAVTTLNQLLRDANVAAADQRFDDANQAYDKAAELDRAYTSFHPRRAAMLKQWAAQLLASGDEQNRKEASRIYNKILSFLPQDLDARNALGSLLRASQLAAEVARYDEELTRLRDLPEAPPERLDHIVNLLDERGEEIGPNDALFPELQRVAQRAIGLRDRRSAFITARQIANAARDRGDWGEAVARYEQAVASFNGSEQAEDTDYRPPAAMVAEFEQWRRVAAAQDAALAAAQALPPIELDDPQRQLDDLGPTEEPYAEALQAADKAGGVPHPDVQQVINQTRVRRRVLETAIRLADRTIPAGSLRREVEALREELGTSTIGRQLAAQLDQRIEDEYAVLQATARAAAARGDTVAQVTTLRTMLELRPDQALTDELRALQRRVTLEGPLSELEAAASIESATLTSARANLRRALELLRDTDHVPDALRGTLRDLLECDNEELKLANEEFYWRASRLLNEIGRAEGWVARRAYSIGERWLNLARESALRGAITTNANLNRILDAYDVALTFRANYPNRPDSRELYLEASSRLAEGMERFAATQISRAEELVERGSPVAALDALGQLFREFYDRIDASPRYSDLIRLIDDSEGVLARQRARAVELRQQAEQLQPLAERIAQQLAEKRNHLIGLDIDAEALRQEIELLPIPPGLADLSRQKADLLAALADRRRAEAQRNVDEILIKADLRNLDRDTLQDLSTMHASLVRGLTQPDELSLPASKIERARNLRARLEQLIKQAEEVGAYRAALRDEQRSEAERLDLLRALLAITNDPVERLRLRREITQLAEASNLRAERDERRRMIERSIDEARRVLNETDDRRYTEVYDQLAQLWSQRGSDDTDTTTARLTDMLAVARNAARLAQASARLESRSRLRGAARLIEQAQELRDRADYPALQKHVHTLQGELAQRIGQLNALTDRVEKELDEQEYAAARRTLDQARRIDGLDPQMQALDEQVEFYEQASEIQKLIERDATDQAEQRLAELQRGAEPASPSAEVQRWQQQQQRRVTELRDLLEAAQQFKVRIAPLIAQQRFRAARSQVTPLPPAAEQRIAEAERRYVDALIRRARVLNDQQRFLDAFQTLVAPLIDDAPRNEHERHLTTAVLTALGDALLAPLQRAREWGTQRTSAAEQSEDVRVVTTRLTPLLSRVAATEDQLLRAHNISLATEHTRLADLVRAARARTLELELARIREIVERRLEPEARGITPADLEATGLTTLEVASEAVVAIRTESEQENLRDIIISADQLYDRIAGLRRERDDRLLAGQQLDLLQPSKMLTRLRKPYRRLDELRAAQVELTQVMQEIQRIAGVLLPAEHELPSIRAVWEDAQRLEDDFALTFSSVAACYEAARSVSRLDQEIDQVVGKLHEQIVWDRPYLVTFLHNLASAESDYQYMLRTEQTDETAWKELILTPRPDKEVWKELVLRYTTLHSTIPDPALDLSTRIEARRRACGEAVSNTEAKLLRASLQEERERIDREARLIEPSELANTVIRLSTQFERLPTEITISQRSAMAEDMLVLASTALDRAIEEWDTTSGRLVYELAQSFYNGDKSISLFAVSGSEAASIFTRQLERYTTMQDIAQKIERAFLDGWRNLSIAIDSQHFTDTDIEQNKTHDRDKAIGAFYRIKGALKSFEYGQELVKKGFTPPEELQRWALYCQTMSETLDNIEGREDWVFNTQHPGPSVARAERLQQKLEYAERILKEQRTKEFRHIEATTLLEQRRRWAYYSYSLELNIQSIQRILRRFEEIWRARPTDKSAPYREDMWEMYNNILILTKKLPIEGEQLNIVGNGDEIFNRPGPFDEEYFSIMEHYESLWDNSIKQLKAKLRVISAPPSEYTVE